MHLEVRWNYQYPDSMDQKTFDDKLAEYVNSCIRVHGVYSVNYTQKRHRLVTFRCQLESEYHHKVATVMDTLEDVRKHHEAH